MRLRESGRTCAALGLALWVAACGEGPESRLVLAERGIPIRCSNGHEPGYAAVPSAEGERIGLTQPASSECTLRLELPVAARLEFRASIDAVDYMKGRSARAAIVREADGAARELFARQLGGLEPFYDGAVELPAGVSELSLRAAAGEDPGRVGAIAWTDLELVARAVDPGPDWTVNARTALAPFLAGTAPPAPRARLLVIGVDGGSWALLQRMLEDGELPALAALRARGRWGVLRSSAVPTSAIGWAALATGANPGKTGVFGPRDLPPARPAFWDLVAAAGRTPMLVAVPGARAEGAGLRVADSADAADDAWTQPRELAPYLERAGFGREPVALRDVGKLVSQMDRRADVVAELLRGTDWDLAFFVCSHTELSARQFGLYSDAWVDTYRALDADLARLLDAVDAQTTVLLVSAYGGSYYDRSLYLNAWLSRSGWRLGAPAAGNTGMISARPGADDFRSLAARLAQLRDPDTGETVVAQVLDARDVFVGPFRPPGQGLVVAEPDYFLSDRPMAPGARLFRGSADASSRDGLYLLAGPGVEPGPGGERSIYDVAPSVLRFFGVQPPADLDGSSLPALAHGLRENER